MPIPVFIKPVVAWDVEAIFVAAGGTKKLLKTLDGLGFDKPAEETAYMWRSRGKIPNAWMPTVLYVLLKEGRAKLHQLIKVVGGEDDE